jgi:class 3 adenylate cyclase/tetratricopeptide (TPR) repeat protein
MACPGCGKTNPPDSTFCNGCGQRLRAEDHISPFDYSHTPNFLAEKIPATPSTINGERKHVTVLFSDLSGYTALSEKLDPEEVKEITTRIFGEVAQIVARYDGFVEKYVGDAVLALFGVPKAHEDDHIRAIRAAQEIHESVDGIGGQYVRKIGRRLAFHTGITTGLVVTGEVNLDKGTHGVAGDTINLASRLCGLAKPGEILVNESTYLQSTGAFSFDRLEPVSVKGKAEAITPYRLLQEKDQPSKGLAAQGISSPLVGRNAEVAAIKGCINRLLDGQGGILSVIGEAGLGKSRLVAEIRHSFAHENLLWLEGHTLSYGQKMSYWPFREIFWHFTGITEDDSDTEAWEKFEKEMREFFPTDSAEIIPYLANLIGLEVKGDLGKNLQHLDGESMGKQIYLSSRRFFERLAHNQPVVLFFEDLHWADESTVALIAHLFPLINRVPLLICGVSRPEEAPAARLKETALKDNERRYTEIRLSPLSSTECTDLMNNLLTIENLPSRTRQLIIQKAEGNPFFLEEIMRTLVDRGAVHCENGHWRATSAIETITVPDTIQGVIMARIDRLDEEVKQVLKTASVIGRTFFYRVLRGIEGAIQNLDQDLDRLKETELIREKQKVPELEYIFAHALVQESTYESILLKKRHELHGKVASAIETLFADRLDEFSSVLAYHYANAEDWEKAQGYLFKAGDQAGRIAADAEALTHYEQALESYARVFGDKWEPLERASLERKMGEAFYRSGEHEKATEYFQRALSYLGRPLPISSWRVLTALLHEVIVQIGHRLAPQFFVKNERSAVGRAVEEEVRTYDTMTYMIAFTGPMQHLLIGLRELNLSERTGFSYGLFSGFLAQVYAAVSIGAFRISGFYAKRAVTLAERTRDPLELAPAYFVLALHELQKGARLREGADHALLSAEVFRKVSYWNVRSQRGAIWVAGIAFVWLGDFSRALVYAEDLIRYGEGSKDPWTWCAGLFVAGWAQTHMGRFEEALPSLRRAVELAEAIPDYGNRSLAGSALGLAYLRQGDIEQAKVVLEESDRFRSTHAMPPVWDGDVHSTQADLCMAFAERSRGSEKLDWLKKARLSCRSALKGGRIFGAYLPRALGCRGTYEWLRGKSPAARTWWQRSLAAAKEKDMRWELATTHLEIGKRLNDHEHLRQAEAIFADIGADYGLAEARRLLQPLGERKGA